MLDSLLCIPFGHKRKVCVLRTFQIHVCQGNIIVGITAFGSALLEMVSRAVEAISGALKPYSL